MDLRLSPAEADLSAALESWLGSRFTFPDLLERLKTTAARDDALWAEIVGAGWVARSLPRRNDLQQSVIDAAIVAEAFGRGLVIEPFFRSAHLAANLLFEIAPPDLADSLIADIAADRVRFACALYEPEGRHRFDHVRTRAEEDAGGWRLTGRKSMVLDGADASHLLVTARTGDGVGLFLVEGQGHGVKRSGFHTADDFAAADIAFEAARAGLISTEVLPGLERGIDRSLVTLGAETLGAATAALDETARYAGERKQFGRTIASFQVVSHRLARMFVELEVLRGGLNHALSCAEAPPEERAFASAGLKHLIGESGRFIANQGVQLHGGVGTLQDFKVSHCFKRIVVGDTLFGSADYHLDRCAALVA